MYAKTTAALAALLLAAAGAAAAQEQAPAQADGGHDRADRPANANWANHANGERPQQSAWRAAPPVQPVTPPHAQAAPAAAAPIALQPPRARPAPTAGANLEPRPHDPNWPGRGHYGDVGPAGGLGPNANPADRADAEDWDELRQARYWGGHEGEHFAFVQGDAPTGPPQPQDHRGDRGNRGDHRGDHGPRPGASPGGQGSRPGPTPSAPGPRPGAVPAGPGPVQGQQDRQFRGGDHYDRNRVPPAGPDHNRGGWSDRDRDRDHRRDHPEWRRGGFPPVYRTPHRFHVAPYHWPFGYGVRAWGYGEILPPAFWGPSYEILDWWVYDLPAPPPGFSWVRVGYDALLVDRYDGRVVQVFRGLFWW